MLDGYCHVAANESIGLPIGKVVCVGRNYADHIAELNNQVSDYPLLFIKPSTSLCSLNHAITIPSDKGECQNELELAFLIDEPLTKAEPALCRQAIWGVGLALDLTLRDLQTRLKAEGKPWERAKGFDGACPISSFVKLDKNASIDFDFSLHVNDELRQSGSSKQMIWPTLDLLSLISQEFTLLPGDIVLTGTPKGVAALHESDKLTLTLHEFFEATTRVSVI